MTSKSVFIEADDEVLDPEPRQPPLGLPRLQIFHLLAWTTAIAVAFLPYGAQQEMMEQFRVRAGQSSQVVSTADLSGVYGGIVSGSFLFVAAAFFLWKRQGRQFRRHPGHVLAIQGAALWGTTVIAEAFLMLVDSRSPLSMAWLSLPAFGVGLIFFIWFLRIATRRGEPRRWRWAFGTLALAPVLTYFGMIIVGIALAVGGFRTLGGAQSVMPIFVALAMGLPAVVQGATLGAAMIGDWRLGVPQHWSHWIACGARLTMTFAVIGTAAWMALFFHP